MARRSETKAKKAAADRNRQVTAFGSQTTVPEAGGMKVKTQNNLLSYIRNIYGIALEKRLIAEDPFQHVKNFPQSGKFEKEPASLTPESGSGLGIKMNKTIYAKPPIIVKEVAEQLGISRFQLIHDLAGMNVFVRSGQSIKPEVATAICKQYGFTLLLTPTQ